MFTTAKDYNHGWIEISLKNPGRISINQRFCPHFITAFVQKYQLRENQSWNNAEHTSGFEPSGMFQKTLNFVKVL
jgi:hypothetical protein